MLFLSACSWSSRPGLACLVCLACLADLPASEVEIEVADEHAVIRDLIHLMRALPAPPPGQLREAPPPEGFQELAPGLAVKLEQAVRIEAETIFAQGPADGLEVLLCLRGGKNHEALAWAQTGNGQLVKTAFLLALELQDGLGSEEESGFPARGTPLRVLARWQPDVFLEPDRWVEVDASQLVRDRGSQRAYPPLPYVYTGSRIRMVPMSGRDGGIEHHERFMLDVTKSIVVNFDEPDALLASPFPLAARDVLFEVNSALAPAERMPIWFYFESVTLPLILEAQDERRLSYQGQEVDDQRLQELLREHYHNDRQPLVHAFGIRMPQDAPREWDVQIREHMLRLAAQAEVWAVPIFMLPEPGKEASPATDNAE